MGKTVRNAFIRLSAVNIAHKDNEALGIKEGDTITYTKDDVKANLDDWSKTKDIKYYFAEHDYDSENVHFHIVITFPDDSVCDFMTLKNRFPYGDLEGCKHSVKRCVQYLIHMNDPEKHQYEWDDVITNCPAMLELYKIRGDYTKNAKLNHILDQIYKGKIKEYEITSKIDYNIFIKYESKIMRAFRYVSERDLTDADRELQVYVLQGPPRVGKSTYCKCWAKLHNMSIGFSAGGKNPFDQYRNQEVYVLDDFNYSVTSIDDMKKFLDPHNNAGVAARYHNALFKNCKVIFICTNTPITKWYLTESMEDRDAFFMRISYVLNFGDISDDFVTKYTVNEVVYRGKDDFIEMAINMYHEYKQYELKSVDGVEHIFDLKKYINPTTDIVKKQQFLSGLDAI